MRVKVSLIRLFRDSSMRQDGLWAMATSAILTRCNMVVRSPVLVLKAHPCSIAGRGAEAVGTRVARAAGRRREAAHRRARAEGTGRTGTGGTRVATEGGAAEGGSRAGGTEERGGRPQTGGETRAGGKGQAAATGAAADGVCHASGGARQLAERLAPWGGAI
jgi:hypothetical protein